MNDKEARVFVIQQPMKRVGNDERPAFDFSAAKIYGDVQIIAPNGKQILTPDVFREFLRAQLHDFDPGKDFIIPAGDYSVIFMVGMLIGDMHGHAMILRWVPSALSYQPIFINVTA